MDKLAAEILAEAKKNPNVEFRPKYFTYLDNPLVTSSQMVWLYENGYVGGEMLDSTTIDYIVFHNWYRFFSTFLRIHEKQQIRGCPNQGSDQAKRLKLQQTGIEKGQGTVLEATFYTINGAKVYGGPQKLVS